MSENNFREFMDGVRDLPEVSPPEGMYASIQNKIQSKKRKVQQVQQLSAVSLVVLAVASLTVLHDPASESVEYTVAESQSSGSDDVTNLNTIESSQVMLMSESQDPVLTESVIVLRILDINDELDQLTPNDAERKQSLLDTKHALERSYRTVRHSTSNGGGIRRAVYRPNSRNPL